MNTQGRATYLPLVDAIATHAQRNKALLSPEATSAIAEARFRLMRLDRQYSRLLELNEALRAGDAMTLKYDESTSTFHAEFGGGLKQTFQIPDVSGPLELKGLGDIASFDAGAPVKHLGPEHAALRMELEELVEAYYYGAHRLTVLIRKLPGQKGFSCMEMIVVRNDLLEHTKGEVSYDFGYGTGGPFVRPTRVAGSPPKDKGAVANTAAYVAMLQKAFDG